MRLTPEQLKKITGYTRHSAQVRWFSEYLGVLVASDHDGPIMTEAAYEKLIQRKYGLLPDKGEQPVRPQVRQVRKAA